MFYILRGRFLRFLGGKLALINSVSDLRRLDSDSKELDSDLREKVFDLYKGICNNY